MVGSNKNNVVVLSVGWGLIRNLSLVVCSYSCMLHVLFSMLSPALYLPSLDRGILCT